MAGIATRRRVGLPLAVLLVFDDRRVGKILAKMRTVPSRLNWDVHRVPFGDRDVLKANRLYRCQRLALKQTVPCGE